MPDLVTLRPGARGTIQLTRKYGDRLLFVRYRYLRTIHKRYKTVELIEDERPWTPKHVRMEYVSLYVDPDDHEVQHSIQTHDGKWDQTRGVWLLPGYKVHMLGLEEWVIPDLPPNLP